jgi:2-polyprenyl-3-methyl-5-hydroxy-6-metoxy-1,4-benzoquinol methylase
MTGISDPGYFLNQRLDVAALVPTTVRSILDVGCGAGRLGQYLKETLPGCRITGIEREAAMADVARSVLDEVLVADLETLGQPFPSETFDCIIFADILEHLVHPEDLLHRFRPMLHHGGCIVCSIPNVRHYSAILRLLMRGWMYEEYGVFDKTHLRFFSLRGMQEMIQEAGYTIDLVRPRVVASRKARVLTAPIRRHVEEFLAFQYLIRAMPG